MKEPDKQYAPPALVTREQKIKGAVNLAALMSFTYAATSTTYSGPTIAAVLFWLGAGAMAANSWMWGYNLFLKGWLQAANELTTWITNELAKRDNSWLN